MTPRICQYIYDNLINIYLPIYCKSRALNEIKDIVKHQRAQTFYFRDIKFIMTMIWKIRKIEFKDSLKENDMMQ